MLRADIGDYQLYLSRVRPIYHQLFNLAHAVTGNCDQAEYCLQCAMLECWSAGDASASHHGFREGLRSSVLRVALRVVASPQGEEAEFDWDGLLPDSDSADPIDRLIAQERMEFRRVLALRYGCKLSPRRIARILDIDVRRIQAHLRRFEARARRRLSGADARRCEARIHQAVRAQLALPSPLAPEMSSVFRTFQADAAGMSQPSHLPSRILRLVFGVILAVICIAAFWFAAVLIQPPDVEAPAAVPIQPPDVEAPAAVLIQPPDVEAPAAVPIQSPDAEAPAVMPIQSSDMEAPVAMPIQSPDAEALAAAEAVE